MPDQFFMTWNKQNDAPHMSVSGAVHDEFITSDEKRIYDFTSTSFQASFGHSCDPIRERIHQQLERMPIASPKSLFPLKEIVSRRLLELIDLDDGEANPGKIFYTVSGSESVENALKIARQVTGRKIVLARQSCYHGASLGSMSVSSDWRNESHLTFEEGTVRIPEPDDDLDAVRFGEIIQETGPENIAAFIVETISGVNGVVVPPLSWWDGVTRHCRKHGIKLICDEVLAGFGRTGPPFAYQHFELRPDIVCMSKGITGGYVPFGAVWVRDDIATYYDDEVLACGLTNYGHPLGLAALDAVLDLLSDVTFSAGKLQLELAFGDLVNNLVEENPHLTGFRQRGLLAAIDFKEQAPSWQECLDAGLYLVRREKMLVIAPPFVSSIDRLHDAFGTLQGVIRSAEKVF